MDKCSLESASMLSLDNSVDASLDLRSVGVTGGRGGVHARVIHTFALGFFLLYATLLKESRQPSVWTIQDGGLEELNPESVGYCFSTAAAALS